LVTNRLPIYPYQLPKKIDNIFIIEALEEQYAKNKAVNKDIYEWINSTESMG